VSIVHGRLLGCRGSCTKVKGVLLVEEKVYTFGEGDSTSGVHVVLILGGKIKVKGKSQAGGLGTGCRSQGPNQDKSLCLRLSISEICFPLHASYLFCLFT